MTMFSALQHGFVLFLIIVMMQNITCQLTFPGPFFNITTIGGKGNSLGDKLIATKSILNYPTGLLLNSSSTNGLPIYFCDTNNNRIRKIDANNVITTVAGNGLSDAFSNTYLIATQVSLNAPTSLSMLSNGNIVFTDTNNNCIRMLELTTGMLSVIAGNSGNAGNPADGSQALSSLLNQPTGITVSSLDEIFISQPNSNSILKFTIGGTISTILSETDGISKPHGLTIHEQTLFIADSFYLYKFENNQLSIVCESSATDLFFHNVSQSIYFTMSDVSMVKRCFLNGSLVVVAGGGQSGNSGDGIVGINLAYLDSPKGVVVTDSGDVYISDTNNHRIRKVSNSYMTTIAGMNSTNFGDDIPLIYSSISSPMSVFYDNGFIFYADKGNHIVRNFSTSTYTQYNVMGKTGVAGTNNAGYVPLTETIITSPTYTMRRDFNQKVFTIDNGCSVKRIDVSIEIVYNVGGSCIETTTYSAQTGLENVYFKSNSLVLTLDSNIFIADYYNHLIYKMNIATRRYTIYVGVPNSPGYSGDGPLVESAQLNSPQGLVLDSSENLYIADTGNHCIRMVTKDTGIITKIAGTPTSAGYSGDGGKATDAKLNTPVSIQLTSTGEIIFFDKGNNVMRKITTTGYIFTIAGMKSSGGYSGDEGPALQAQFNSPNGLTLAPNGEIVIADTNNNVIRKLYGAYCKEHMFYNASTYSCQCYPNYSGETCDTFYCNGVLNNQSNVCSSHGNCISYNNCNCSTNYYGGSCENWNCNGTVASSASVCSSKGICVSPDNCKCQTGYYGLTCEKYNCFNISSLNSTVCSSRGQCTAYDTCQCPTGYYGSKCELYNCNDIVYTNSSVCSGNGYCLSINNCTCKTGYYGTNCDKFDCAGTQYDGTNICLNNGTCRGPGDCQCLTGWGGSRCEYITCFNKTSVDKNVCSGHGACYLYNNCTCESGWFSKDCSLTTCFGIVSNNQSSVCSKGHGYCTAPDTCTCLSGYGGQQCQYYKCLNYLEIDSQVCSGHGSCNLPNHCSCKDGYTGDDCQYHEVFYDISKAFIYSSYSALMNYSTVKELVVDCGEIFGRSELSKFGESDFMKCIWTSNSFKLYLGFDHSITHGSILKLNNFYNISLYVNGTSSLSTLSSTKYTSSINSLPDYIPSTQDFIVRSNSDDTFHNFKKMRKVWTCESCTTNLLAYLANCENQTILNIPISLLNEISLDSSFVRMVNLVLNSYNSLGSSISSTATTKVQPNAKNLPPSVTWLGDNGKSETFTCVGHTCIIEASLNSVNSTLSYTFSGFFSLLNAEFTQKQMYRLVNIYNNELVDSEYSSGTSVVGFQLKTYASVSISSSIYYKTFDRLDYVLTNVNRTYPVSVQSITIDVYNEDPFISTFTVKSYFTYKYSCYRVDSVTLVPTSEDKCSSISNNGQSLTLNPSSMGFTEGVYSVNLVISFSNSFVTIPYSYVGYLTFTGYSSSVPSITIDNLPAVYPNGVSLPLQAVIVSSSPLISLSWRLVKGKLLVDQLPEATNTVLDSNKWKSILIIDSSYIIEGEFYAFEVSVTNQYGTSNVTLSTRIDLTPRFSCSFYNLGTDQVYYAYETLVAISCLNLPDEPVSSFIMEIQSQSGERLNVLSNTVRRGISTRIPMNGEGESVKLVVFLVNRYGSVGKIERIIPVQLPSTLTSSGNSLTFRIQYVIQAFNTLKKSEPIKIDTSNSINALVSILIQNQTIQQFTNKLSEVDSTLKQSLVTALKEMLTYLKSIQSLTYKVDEKIIPLLLPTVSDIYSLLNLNTQDESWVSDISTWIDWVYTGMTSAKTYYSSFLLETLLDDTHFAELLNLQEILSSRYSSSLDKQYLLASYRAKYLILTGYNSTDTSSGIVSIDSPSQFNGKSFVASVGSSSLQNIIVTFPNEFSSQVSSLGENSKVFLSTSIVKSDKTSGNIMTNRPLIEVSIYNSNGNAVSVSGLTSTVTVKFTNFYTDSKTNLNISCIYYDSSSSTWSYSGLSSSWSTVKTENGLIYFDLECKTSHLSLFSVIETEYVTPQPSKSSDSKISESNVLAIALGITLPLVVLLVVGFVVILVIMAVFIHKLKNKPQGKTNGEVAINMSDFPSDASFFMSPLVSMSSSSASESFNPLSRYLDLERIGKGAFGSVFKAFDSKTNSMKAIKVIKYTSTEELNNFMKEGTQLMNVNHPNILKVNDFFISQDNLLCIDMDFYEKGDLVQLTSDNFECSEKLLIEIMYQMCNALNYIHSTMRVIHRDIKPSNIFIKSLDQDEIQVIVADFGLARQNQGSIQNSYAGTPLFMSPELGYGGKYFYNTDIYSLGVTLYQIMTKDTSTSISQLHVTREPKEVMKILRKKMEEPGIYSSQVIELVLSMLEKDCVVRPQSQDLMNSPLFQRIQRK